MDENVPDQVLFQSQLLFLKEFFTWEELSTWKLMRLYNELQSCGYKIRRQRFCELRRKILAEHEKQLSKEIQKSV